MMDREALRATLVTLLEEEMGESYDLADDASDLREGLGLDSVDVVGLVMKSRASQFRDPPGHGRADGSQAVGPALDLIQGKLAARTSILPPTTICGQRRPDVGSRRPWCNFEWSLTRLPVASPALTIATPRVIRAVPSRRAVPTFSCKTVFESSAARG